MPLSGKYLNFISVKLPLFSLAITSHEGKGPAVLRWLRHLFMHSGPLLMPVGQGHKLLEAGKWFKLIFSRLAKPFNLVLWDTTRTCSSKKSEAAEAGQRSSGLFNKIVLRRVLLAWIYKLNVREKKLWYIYTQAPFLCPYFQWFLTTIIPLPASGLETNFFQNPFSQAYQYSLLTP